VSGACAWPTTFISHYDTNIRCPEPLQAMRPGGYFSLSGKPLPRSGSSRRDLGRLLASGKSRSVRYRKFNPERLWFKLQNDSSTSGGDLASLRACRVLCRAMRRLPYCRNRQVHLGPISLSVRPWFPVARNKERGRWPGEPSVSRCDMPACRIRCRSHYREFQEPAMLDVSGPVTGKLGRS
jgi:hypothetical protein